MGSCSSSSFGLLDGKSSVLTANDIVLIKNSWRIVVQTGLSRYGTNMMVRLFIKYKELKHLWSFSKGLETEEQMRNSERLILHGEKLFGSIDIAINTLDDLTTLIPILIQIGYNHYKWGVRDEHFPYIGAALIETLENGLNDVFTPKVKEAWIKLFGIVESQMKVGLRRCEADL